VFGAASAVVLTLLVTFVAFQPVMDAPIIPSPTEIGPRSSAKKSPAIEKILRKRRAPSPPVAGFPIMTAQAAGTGIPDEDFVVGVELNGETRAYAINVMGKPESELLNDTLANRPIAVTFCGTCQSPIVFSREVAGKTLTLFLSGELYADNMVMADVETGSKWVQLTGEAIQGPLKGQRLEQLAAIWTDWNTWRERHPGTTAPELPRVVQNYQHHPQYSAYLPERSFFAKIQWGLARGDRARSYPYAQLSRQSIVNDLWSGQPLLVLFDRTSSTVAAFGRRVGDRELTFHLRAEGLTDDQTNTFWDPLTGRAKKGPMAGHRLTPVPGVVSLDWVWRIFYPDSEIWSAEDVQ